MYLYGNTNKVISDWYLTVNAQYDGAFIIPYSRTITFYDFNNRYIQIIYDVPTWIEMMFETFTVTAATPHLITSSLHS